MKIIKYGEGYPMRIGCTECHSVLEIELGDILSRTTPLGVEQSTIKQKILQYIICPVCGEMNVVKDEIKIVGYTIGK